MYAYELDRKVSIMQKAGAIDPDYGTETSTWITVAAQIWANVQDTLPRKSESALQGIRIGTLPMRVWIRRRSGITSDMRIVLHGTVDRTFEIVAGPAEIDDRRLLEFLVTEYSTMGDA